jgi:hypothetical protein
VVAVRPRVVTAGRGERLGPAIVTLVSTLSCSSRFKASSPVSSMYMYVSRGSACLWFGKPESVGVPTSGNRSLLACGTASDRDLLPTLGRPALLATITT